MQITTVKIIDLRYHNKLDGFFIAIRDDGSTVKGFSIYPPYGFVNIGWEPSSSKNKDSNWGPYIWAEKVFFGDDATITKILLDNGYIKGIRSSKAIEAMATVGDEIWKILDGCVDNPFVQITVKDKTLFPNQHLERVKGIGKIVLSEMVASWRDKRHTFACTKLAMMTGINLKQYAGAIKELAPDGPSSIGAERLTDKILHSPYSLTELDEFTWTDADIIAQMEIPGKTAVDHNSVERLAAAVREAILRERLYGNLGGDYSRVMAVAHKLATPDRDIAMSLGYLEDHGLRMVGDVITTEELYKMEKSAAERLAHISKNKCKGIPDDIDPQKFCDKELDALQIEAILMMLRNGLSLVTGGPGTGKTSIVIDTFLKILDSLGISYTLCAPTGIAAIRIKKTSGKDASTIHRAFNLAGKQKYAPQTDYIIVDEVSMNDGPLQAEYLNLMTWQRLVYIGDKDQLPPVGPGFPLKEMIGHIPHTHLTHVYRQGAGSGIITAAHDINNRRLPVVPEGQKDFQVFYARPDKMADKAIKLAEELLAEGVTDILVMSPVKKDHGGRNDVNDQMKQHFNPENKNVPPLRFSIADPIIATKNNYRDEIMVMNGQIGSVSSINLSAIEAAKNMPREEADTFPVVTVDFHEFTGEKVLSVIEAAQFELAYCITIHKSQGNQASAALCLLPPTGEGFYMKELPFTAVTRGVNFAWVITPSPEIFKRYLVNNNRINRISLLGKFLSGILQ